MRARNVARNVTRKERSSCQDVEFLRGVQGRGRVVGVWARIEFRGSRSPIGDRSEPAAEVAGSVGLSFIHNSDNSNGDGPTHGMRFALVGGVVIVRYGYSALFLACGAITLLSAFVFAVLLRQRADAAQP